MTHRNAPGVGSSSGAGRRKKDDRNRVFSRGVKHSSNDE